MKNLEEIGNKIREFYDDYPNAIVENRNMESEIYDEAMEFFQTMFPQKEKIEHRESNRTPHCLDWRAWRGYKISSWEKKDVFKDREGNKTPYRLVQSGNNILRGDRWDYRDCIWKKSERYDKTLLFEKKDTAGMFSDYDREVIKRVHPYFKEILEGLEMDTRLSDGF